MQILKTHEIDLLRMNGAEFTNFRLIPETDNPKVFSVSFSVKNGTNIEDALLMSSRNRVRTFGEIYKAIDALYQVFPELQELKSIEYVLPKHNKNILK